MLVPVFGGGGVGPQVNHFEQVSSDDHQMLVVGGRYRGLMFGEGWRGGEEGRSKGVPYHLTYPMMHLMLPPSSPCVQTDACENSTFPKFRLYSVKSYKCDSKHKCER